MRQIPGVTGRLQLAGEVRKRRPLTTALGLILAAIAGAISAPANPLGRCDGGVGGYPTSAGASHMSARPPLFFSISLSISPALISALDGVARACYVYLNVH
jgi:hypothetical protein